MFTVISLTALLIPLVPVLIFILLTFFVVRVLHRMERRADERLKIDRENMTLQQKQMQGIDDRLTRIENMLKEVD
ncbi:MAG: hypothetical protein ACE3JK_08905 [Sporolactobacillus sp.]